MSDILEELKKRLLSVIDGYKKFKPQAPTNNNPSTNPSANTNQPANNNNPITASKTLSASVGEGGTNKPEDVALVKTLINKFIKAFDLNDNANLGKVGATTIKVIKQFQQEKVGLPSPDGRIDAGGKSWKVLNGEAQPVSNSQGSAQGGASSQLINSIQTTGASNHTAGQDGLDGKGLSGVEVSQTMAKTDLERVTKYKDLFVKIGKEQGVPASILAAIASRETRGREVIGDHGNGFGIIQVDKRYHPEKVAKIEAKQGLARVEESIRQGAIILKDYIGQIKAKFPNWTPAQQLKGALAAYNAGVSTVQTLEGMDKGTTGDDYSGDVIARAQFMDKNGFAEESAPANNQPAANGETKPANGETKPTANNQPVTASTTLSDSVGEGGKNKPEDVALVKTLINKFIKAFNLSDTANLSKMGKYTVDKIKEFQQQKVGIENPDGRIDVGGKSWKVLNGETPPAASTNDGAPTGNYYSHPNAANVGAIRYGNGVTARKMIPEAEKLLQSILAKAGLSASEAQVNSTKRSYYDQARIIREDVDDADIRGWYGLDPNVVKGFSSHEECAKWFQTNAPNISNHIPGYALDVQNTSSAFHNALNELIPVKGSGVRTYLREDHIGITHVEFTFEVTSMKGRVLKF